MSALRLQLQRAASKSRHHAIDLHTHITERSPLIDANGDASHGGSGGGAWSKPARACCSYPAEGLRLVYLTLAQNYTNVLLIFLPIAIAAGALGWSAVAVFSLNFLAIVPLASLLSFATEELAAVLGQTLGGLLNASFGNMVELIVSIVALREGKIRIVQASMIGSILSNTLLILGCCFVAGGIQKAQQSFNRTLTATMSSLMTVSSISLILPTTLYAVVNGKKTALDREVNILSRGISILLLLLYGLYLLFQLRTHVHLFEKRSEESLQDDHSQDNDDDEEEEAGPQVLRPWPAFAALVIITSLIAVCAEFLVDSIDEIVQSGVVSETFIGIILLPIVSNAAEHVTAVVVSYKSKMDLAVGVALGSGLQIALLVMPFLVILGWIIDQPMTLRFETFETIVFFLTILVMNNLIHDGKSNYLEGAICLGTYVIIALAFFVYPDNAVESPNMSHMLDFLAT